MIPVELPTFEATWWPLQMETVLGSGERITVAVMVRAASGQTQVRQVIDPPTINALFGTSGKGMQAMIASVVVGLQQQLDAGVATADLVPAFGGFDFAHGRDGVARDLNEVFDVAVALSSGLAESPFGRVTLEVQGSSKEAFNDWADRVQAELLEHQAQVRWQAAEHFQVNVKLASKKVRFGVLRGGYAANLGVLRPGHTSGDGRSLKAKVFDLEALRRDLTLSVNEVDLLVGCPPHQALSAFSRREVEGYYQSLDFIEAEAKERQVTLLRCDDPQAAARRIQLKVG